MAPRGAELFEIRDGIASAGIRPDLGGSLAWFRTRDSGATIDWLRAAPADTQRADDMACFPLVPFSNRVRASAFSFGGREVRLPVTDNDPHFEHGHGWRSPWMVEHRTGSEITLVYPHEPDAWPWRYEARQEIAVAGGALTIRLEIRNTGEDPMPAGLGLHPFLPDAAGALVETSVRGMWETDGEVLPTRHVALEAPRTAFRVAHEALDNVFTGWSRQARVSWRSPARSLVIEADGPLDFLVLYTPQDDDFFCCEPVSNVTDAFNLSAQGIPATGIQVLASGTGLSATVRFTPGSDTNESFTSSTSATENRE